MNYSFATNGLRAPTEPVRVEGYLTDVLAEGTASRLYQRLVKRDQLATHVGALLGTFGDPFDMRDPTRFALSSSQVPSVVIVSFG